MERLNVENKRRRGHRRERNGNLRSNPGRGRETFAQRGQNLSGVNHLSGPFLSTTFATPAKMRGQVTDRGGPSSNKDKAKNTDNNLVDHFRLNIYTYSR